MTNAYDLPEMQSLPPKRLSPARPLYWSIRREIWENRSIYVAPMIVAAFVLCGFTLSLITLPQRRLAVSKLSVEEQRHGIEMPYDVAAGMLILTTSLVGAFYCVDALHGERRDRSILFWKSLPVSDQTTVLSKIAIPVIILPLIALSLILTMHAFMAILANFILLMAGVDPGMLVSQLRFIPSPLVLVYAVLAMLLWHLPVYAWFLLISAWAKRATFLWALLPPMLIAAFEHVAFRTSYIGLLIRERLTGWMAQAFLLTQPAIDRLDSMTPGRYITTPALWVGFFFAAAFLVATIRLRRNREPI